MPESYFKYCPIYDVKNFENEYSIKNLLNDQIRFSTRKSFNDLFDTDININVPSKEEIKSLRRKLNLKNSKKLKSEFIDTWSSDKYLSFKRTLNDIIDKYLILCVSSKNDSNLMWSHYSSNHTGFCIEFYGDDFISKFKKVQYQKEKAAINFIDYIKFRYGLISDDDFYELTYSKFFIKLDDWKYESEYRLIFSRQYSDKTIIKEEYDKFSIIALDRAWIKSIIFGVRMPSNIRDFIIKEMGGSIQYKEAYIPPRASKLEIKPYVTN